jgi:hypothetical protein
MPGQLAWQLQIEPKLLACFQRHTFFGFVFPRGQLHSWRGRGPRTRRSPGGDFFRGTKPNRGIGRFRSGAEEAGERIGPPRKSNPNSARVFKEIQFKPKSAISLPVTLMAYAIIAVPPHSQGSRDEASIRSLWSVSYLRERLRRLGRCGHRRRVVSERFVTGRRSGRRAEKRCV